MWVCMKLYTGAVCVGVNKATLYMDCVCVQVYMESYAGTVCV